MILALKTDQSLTEIHLLDKDGKEIRKRIWDSGRTLARDIVGEIDKILAGNFNSLTGLVVYKGTGSFTGLRIGVTTMNTLSYSLNIPIVGVTGDSWLVNGLGLLSKNENHKIVLPEYGASPNITKAKK